MIRDVQKEIEREEEWSRQVRAREQGKMLPTQFFDDYRSYEDILAYYNGLMQQFPNLISKAHVGLTFEGRDIWVYTVGNNATGNGTKPSIWYEGGIHSCEWIGHTTVAYILTQLVTLHGQDPHVTHLVDSINWYIVPTVNVDGYEYTWSTDRMWRKTRSTNSGSDCIGTDPNRNWDNHWCQVGADQDPCSESYCGATAFSEKAVKAVSDFLLTVPNLQGFIDFHSFSQLWMRPYGWTDQGTPDAATQQELGQQCVQAILNTHQMTYKEGVIYEIVYPASGSSADWVYDSTHAKWSYGVELRDTGQYGMLLPADQIVPTGEEIWAAAQTMGDYILSHQ